MTRADFSLFRNNPKLVYLDYAATTPVPDRVVEAVSASLQHRAPVNRSLYPLASAATESVADARKHIGAFFGAKPEEVIFQSSATAALNQAILGLENAIQPGDILITSTSEHHSVTGPMIALAEKTGATLRFIEMSDSGELSLDELRGAKLIALSLVSNVSGTALQLEPLKKVKSEQGSELTILLDCCQAASHARLDFATLPADLAVVAGHKLYGPDGIGILLGKSPNLEILNPLLIGGGTLHNIKHSSLLWRDLPERLEAGSPNQSAIAGLSAALDYLKPLLPLSTEPISALFEAVTSIPQAQIIGGFTPESGLFAFTLDGIHPHDIAEFLGEKGICVRAGQHCASTYHATKNVPATVRVSTGIGSTIEDAAILNEAILELIKRFYA